MVQTEITSLAIGQPLVATPNQAMIALAIGRAGSSLGENAGLPDMRPAT
jgi:hypothetical protein